MSESASGYTHTCQDGHFMTVMYTYIVALFYMTTDLLGRYIVTDVV